VLQWHHVRLLAHAGGQYGHPLYALRTLARHQMERREDALEAALDVQYVRVRQLLEHRQQVSEKVHRDEVREAGPPMLRSNKTQQCIRRGIPR